MKNKKKDKKNVNLVRKKAKKKSQERKNITRGKSKISDSICPGLFAYTGNPNLLYKKQKRG